ncbi:hypothetical protein D3C77_571030 [compost metagenome]
MAQLDQVLVGRADAHQAAAGAQQAQGFLPVQRAEDTGQELATGIGQRHPGHARHQPGQRRVALAGTLDRFAGDVQGITVGLGQRLGDLRGVVTLAATDIQPARRGALGGQFSQTTGDRGIVTGIEKVAAGFDHGLVVARVAAVLVLHRQQVQVTLASTVETVAGRAGDTVVEGAQRGAAERAGEHQASNRVRVW